MGGGSGGGGTSTTSTAATIAPELQPLYAQTGGLITGQQQNLANQDYWGQFFGPNPQQIPGLTGGEQQLRDLQMQRATGSPYTLPELAALGQIGELTGGPLGTSPATIAAMREVRTPILNDLALAGLGTSDAVASGLGGAYAPILAQEMAMRASLVPQLAGIGASGAARQSSLIGEAMNTEEMARAIEEARGQASLSDFLRRQNLGSQYLTGILGGFPAVGGSTSTTKSKSSGGGGMTVICTELHRQGLMDDETYAADDLFGKTLPQVVLDGYHFWACPLAKKMAQSKLLTTIIRPIAMCWAKEMAFQLDDKRPYGSFIGLMLLKIGVPICGWIGKKLERLKCYG